MAANSWTDDLPPTLGQCIKTPPSVVLGSTVKLISYFNPNPGLLKTYLIKHIDDTHFNLSESVGEKQYDLENNAPLEKIKKTIESKCK